ncbi:hypothetical protein NE236_36130 [Actinoallomurus purpureus]|uniref:hypothetical protein n=1 Tax=Actinoallomurus purpureus TaxID=478114 RepID=UPI00209205EC|nr:hypothetical protein [Actinoallomurus purpureus]MCO6010406.1 hypothetical protein [Actinoallomurus purpureus]
MKHPTRSSPTKGGAPVTASPGRRFVQLRRADAQLGGVTTTMTFLPAAAGTTLGVTNDGVLADIAKRDPQRAERIRIGMQQLIGRNDAVMRWLEADPANTALFTTDPIAALRRALPDLPEDFFNGWQ